MPCTKKLNIDTSKPVLVTGGTGYLAGVLISQLIDHGLTVHTTVRDPTKKDRIQYLQDMADNKRSKTGGSIKFFQADLMSAGSFEEAMKGCHVVFHTASPFTYVVEDPQRDLVDPAVKGTENVLLQANKTPSVKRVVLTSSINAIYTDCAETDPNNPTDESTWNTTASLDHCPYNLGKTLAEQKAWSIAKSQTQWRLATINPTLITGPGLKYHPTSESFKIVKSLGDDGDLTMAMGLPDIGLGAVDVRDVAVAHIAAAYLDEVEGRHILNSIGTTMPEMAAALAQKYYPQYSINTVTLPYIFSYLVWLVAPYTGKGFDRTFVSKNWGYKPYFNNTKSKQALGIDYIPMHKSVQEMYQQMIDAGAVAPSMKCF